MLESEIRAIRLGDVLNLKSATTPKQIRFHRAIREMLPKAFHFSDHERRLFVEIQPGKDPAPRILLGEYNHAAEMVAKDHPSYTLIFEPDTERTLIFDGSRYWKWKPREGWVTARRKNSPETVEEEVLAPSEDELVMV